MLSLFKYLKIAKIFIYKPTDGAIVGHSRSNGSKTCHTFLNE